MEKTEKIVMGAVAIVCGFVVAVIVLSWFFPSPSHVETFTGRLDSIEYENVGSHNSLPTTILHFENHTDFRQSGYHVYALNLLYNVTYSITEFANGNQISFISIEETTGQ